MESSIGHYVGHNQKRGAGCILCHSLPGGDGGELVRGVEDPAGGEGVGGAGLGQALAREDGWREEERGWLVWRTTGQFGLQREDTRLVGGRWTVK